MAASRKLLGFSWNAPSLGMLAGAMEAMAEKTPWLDGVTFSLLEKKAHQWQHLDAFSPLPWSEETLSFPAMKSLKWRAPFLHNFIWTAAGASYEESASHWLGVATRTLRTCYH